MPPLGSTSSSGGLFPLLGLPCCLDTVRMPLLLLVLMLLLLQVMLLLLPLQEE
jgi:hypothetical protein